MDLEDHGITDRLALAGLSIRIAATLFWIPMMVISIVAAITVGQQSTY